MPSVAIIIPFYQRENGILRKTLQSILDQNVPTEFNISIIVVDDGSPSPLDDEVRGLQLFSPFSLTLLTQNNGGCAAARNAGLIKIDGDIDYIAFIDSDDTWEPGHLNRAVSTLEKGYDFYFSDHCRLDYHTSHFEYIDFPDPDIPPSQLRKLGDDLFEIDSDYYFNWSFKKFTSQISTIVYRRSVDTQARFHENLKTAGEDGLFMFNIVRSSDRICFSNRIEALCGKGVNIYYSTFDWNDEAHIRRIISELFGAYAVQTTLTLNKEQELLVNKRIEVLRKSFCFFSVRRFLKTRSRWTRDLINLTKSDPQFKNWYLKTLIKVCGLFLIGKYRPT